MLKWINKKRNQKGFTLIELVVVIAILGILAAIAIPRFAGVQGSANVKSVKATLKSIDSAIAIVAAEKNIEIADVAIADVATNLGWTVTEGKFDGTSPEGVAYSINDAGAAQAVVPKATKWEPKLTADATLTSADLQNK